MRLRLNNESIEAIWLEGVNVVVDANGEERNRAEGYSLMGDQHADGVNSMEGHSDMEFLPSFFLFKVQVYAVLPHWTTFGRIWVAGVRVPPVNRITWLIEIDGLVVSYKLHIEDKAVWFGAI